MVKVEVILACDNCGVHYHVWAPPKLTISRVIKGRKWQINMGKLLCFTCAKEVAGKRR
jgi:hypothetical protein